MAGQNSQVKDSLHLAELPVLSERNTTVRSYNGSTNPRRIVCSLPLIRKRMYGTLNYGMKAVDKWDGGSRRKELWTDNICGPQKEILKFKKFLSKWFLILCA
jgi:hypothetical protein